jgi:hypothetical protein
MPIARRPGTRHGVLSLIRWSPLLHTALMLDRAAIKREHFHDAPEADDLCRATSSTERDYAPSLWPSGEIHDHPDARSGHERLLTIRYLGR